jgi:hypothetical protein
MEIGEFEAVIGWRSRRCEKAVRRRARAFNHTRRPRRPVHGVPWAHHDGTAGFVKGAARRRRIRPCIARE